METEKTKVKFLIHQDESGEDLFAFFPEETYDFRDGFFKMSYSHIGQHSGCHPDYADESREATEEEYKDLEEELESIGYNLEILNKSMEVIPT